MEQEVDMRSHLLLFGRLERHHLNLLGLQLFIVAGARAFHEEHIVDFPGGHHQRLVVNEVGHVDLLRRRGFMP